MKHGFCIAFVLCAISMVPYFGYSRQNACGANEISTNPSQPINNQLPTKKNTFFDWQTQNWNTLPYSPCRTSTVESPFFALNNLEALRQSQDMQWKDGWELARTGLGIMEGRTTSVESPQHVHVILYNRYTGVLRVLLRNCGIVGGNYQMAKVQLGFSEISAWNTDLLELSRPLTALDKGDGFSTTKMVGGG